MLHRFDPSLARSRATRRERALLLESNARERAALASLEASEAAEKARLALERCVQAYDEDIAAFVAHRLLREGAACPVCGSCEHPSPALAGADTDGADIELAEARAFRDAAALNEKDALRKLAVAEATLAEALARHVTRASAEAAPDASESA